MPTFLGLTSFYQRFIPNYATVAQPLTKLTSKECSNNFVWTHECTAAFEQLKQLLCSAPILCYPDFDQEFVLQTDSSDIDLGAVFSTNGPTYKQLVPQVPPTNSPTY
jgi:hypothetical protein